MPQGGKSVVEKLKELKELLDAGVLTQAEFDEKKVVLMGKILAQEREGSW